MSTAAEEVRQLLERTSEASRLADRKGWTSAAAALSNVSDLARAYLRLAEAAEAVLATFDEYSVCWGPEMADLLLKVRAPLRTGDE